MTDSPHAFVHEAELRLEPGTDPGAVGAAVTTALCGHWEHEGPCRWPHNNAIDAGDAAAGFRTLFVAPAGDESEVRDRIERALREGSGWVVVETRPRPVSPGEQPLAERLTAPA
jgi:hypothetical protein